MSSTRSPRSTSSPAGAQRAADELEAFCRFCENALTAEDGSPFVIETFQREILADYFAGGRELVIVLSKKNGKSSLLAALALWHLLAVPFAEGIVVAAARDQAAIILKQTSGFIRRSPHLRQRLKVVLREVRNEELDGRLRVLASDVDSVDGVIPSFVAIDELHRHKRLELYSILRDSCGPRDGRLVAISTAGDREDSPLGELRAKALGLPGLEVDGAHKHARTGDFAYHEWSLDEDEDPYDVLTLKKANPFSEVTLEELRQRIESPSQTDWALRRFSAGQWARGELNAIQTLEWNRCAVETLEVPEEARGPYWGLDLGWKYDTTSMTPVWIHGGGWVEEKIPVRARDGRQLFRREWRRDTSLERAYVGEPIILTPPGDGTSLSVDVIFGAIVDVMNRHPEAVWVADPLAGGEQLVQRIDSELGARVIVHSQANTPMIRASQRLQEMIASGRLVHAGDPGLNAHVMACGVRQVGEGWRIQKQPGSKAPIDAAVALAMALSAGLDDVGEEPPKLSSGVALGFA